MAFAPAGTVEVKFSNLCVVTIEPVNTQMRATCWTHAGLKRNFQVMPGAEWLALLCKHIPDRYEHLVRYVGWYSNAAVWKRPFRDRPRLGERLPCSGAWRRLPSHLPLMSAWIAVFSIGEGPA